MVRLSIVGTFMALAMSVMAAPANIQDLQVSDTSLSCNSVNGTDGMFNCKLEYFLSDPNAGGKNFTAGAICSHQWQWDGHTVTKGSSNNYDSSYKACIRDTGRTLQSALSLFEGPDKVSLKVISSYMSNSNTYLSLFADANLEPLNAETVTDTELVYWNEDMQTFGVTGMTA